MKHTIVIGIGNPLMTDEGIGGFLIEKLLQSKDDFPNVEFIDAGTGGMNLLHLLSKGKKAIIIDCAYMDSTPGTIIKFSPEKVTSKKTLAHQSLHEADIIKIIGLAKNLGQCPESITFFGIEPEKIELGQKLSSTLNSKIDTYIDTILSELKD